MGDGETDVRGRLRRLPSVDHLLQTRVAQHLVAEYGHDATVEALREVLEAVRRAILEGEELTSEAVILDRAGRSLAVHLRPSLYPVINATGVIIHTNLGRAPLCHSARRAMDAVAAGYSNLEYELDGGRRGSRYSHAESLLCQLTGAEGALVVNNNAGAVLLILASLARDREVIISRGQLVEIGGGFRIPEVMRQSGARLVEVGTTNRTYARDYEAAIGEETAAIMRAHRSNFTLAGFVYEPSLDQLVALAHRHGLFMFDDLGSGALLDTSAFGLVHEPMMQESVEAGVDLVCASGDKLLGGPQAGIILGRRELIEQLMGFPLTRALRVDKTTLAGLQATLQAYLTGRAVEEIPVWQMIAMPLEELISAANRWADDLRGHGIEAMAVEARSAVGGGSLPGQTLPTRALALRALSADALAARLRAGTPPIVARIQEGLVLLDPRTVLPVLSGDPEQEERFLRALRQACESVCA